MFAYEKTLLSPLAIDLTPTQVPNITLSQAGCPGAPPDGAL